MSISTVSVGAKSRLAKLLASENITVEHREVETAYFDVKHRILCLPMWKEMSEDVYDMLLVHETGHALHTPMDAWESAVMDHPNPSKFKGFINVCEDARVDKRQKRKYPGARRSYASAFKVLREADFFRLGDRDPNSMGLIDRINLFHKGFSDVIVFSDEEMPFVEAVAAAESFEDALAVAEAIYEYMASDEAETDTHYEPGEAEAGESGEDGESKAPSGQNDDSPNADTDGESASGDSDSGDDSSASGESDESDGDSGDEAESAGSDKDSPESSDSPEGAPGAPEGASSAGENVGPTCETDEAQHESEREMVADTRLGDNQPPIYTSFPRDEAWNLDNLIISPDYIYGQMAEHMSDWRVGHSAAYESSVKYIAKSHDEFVSKNKPIVAYLAKEFEMRKAASARLGARTTRSGSLDTNRLHRHKWDDDVFKRAVELPKGKSHGMVMYVDWSGSMSQSINAVIDQVKVMAMFCKRVGIPFDVYAFSDAAYGAPMFKDAEGNSIAKPIIDREKLERGDYVVSENGRRRQFYLLHLLSSSVRNSKFNEHLRGLTALQASMNYQIAITPPRWLSLCGTPLSQAIMSATPVVNRFRKVNGCEIVHTIFLTDGEGYCPSVVYDPSEDGGEKRTYGGWGRRFIVRDNMSKREWELSSEDRDAAAAFDSAAIEYFKVRTGSTLSNMFLTPNKRSFNNDICAAVRDTDHPIWEMLQEPYNAGNVNAAIQEEWKLCKSDGGVVYYPEFGWSSYFLLPVDTMDATANTVLDDSLTGARKGTIKKAFAKVSSGKVKNRVILRKFIEMVAV